MLPFLTNKLQTKTKTKTNIKINTNIKTNIKLKTQTQTQTKAKAKINTHNKIKLCKNIQADKLKLCSHNLWINKKNPKFQRK